MITFSRNIQSIKILTIYDTLGIKNPSSNSDLGYCYVRDITILFAGYKVAV